MSEFPIRLRRTNIPDEELLADLRRAAESVGKETITVDQYSQLGSFGSTTIEKRFGSWNLALQKAGLQLSVRKDISDLELFQNLAAVWTTLGRQPTYNQMADKVIGSKFVSATYEKRFGSWNTGLIAFSNYISGSGVDDEFDQDADIRSLKSAKLNRRTKRDVNWRLRAKILIRDNCICKMCGASPAKNSETILHVDHVLAWGLGGETVEENLQTLCAMCNIGKSDVLLPGQSATS